MTSFTEVLNDIQAVLAVAPELEQALVAILTPIAALFQKHAATVTAIKSALPSETSSTSAH